MFNLKVNVNSADEFKQVSSSKQILKYMYSVKYINQPRPLVAG